MKMFHAMIVLGFALTGFAQERSAAFLDAIRDGAVGKYVYRVVDDEGTPVSNATAHVWFSSYGRPQDKADWVLNTDPNGVFVAEHRFNERFCVGIDKEGYYHSHDELNYLAMSELPVKDGKWQPFGATRQVVLKRIKKPIKLSASDGLKYYKYPPQGKWAGFDLCKRDWVYPDGSGEFSDVAIRIDREATSKGYVKTMEVAFTNNPFAGAYEMATDAYSDLKSSYEANTNASYSGVYKYVFKRGEKGNERSELAEDRYLVFRTRTKVDAQGNLKSAHYGMIFGNWRFCEKGGMAIEKIVFNLAPNDPNLEDEVMARRSRLNYK